MGEPIRSSGAPEPVGPYSQAIRSGGFVYCAGQIGLDPSTGSLVEGGVELQTRRALENLRAVLDAAGTSLERVVKTSVFLADMAHFQAMNGVYEEFFGETKPARSTVAVSLPKGALVEIDAIAEA